MLFRNPFRISREKRTQLNLDAAVILWMANFIAFNIRAVQEYFTPQDVAKYALGIYCQYTDPNTSNMPIWRKRSSTVEEIPVENKALEYEIQPGDTLSEIAVAFNTKTNHLAELNNIKNPNRIYAGDTIRIR